MASQTRCEAMLEKVANESRRMGLRLTGTCSEGDGIMGALVNHFAPMLRQ